MTGWNCFRCGHEVVWSSDFMKSECGYAEDYDDPNDGLVSYFTCPYCGTRYELVEPDEEEKSDYPYYKESDKK